MSNDITARPFLQEHATFSENKTRYHMASARALIALALKRGRVDPISANIMLDRAAAHLAYLRPEYEALPV